MTHKFAHHLGQWVLRLAFALAACAPVQGTTPPATSTPPYTTTPTATTTPAHTMTVPTFTPAPAARSPQGVLANQGWQDAYLFVHPGDIVELTATGVWSHDPADPQFSNLYGPAGVDVIDAEAVLPSAPIGSLLGRIGDNPPFVIGEHLVLTSEYRGELWLSMNDSPDEFSDNNGFLEVAVGHTTKPVVAGIRLTNLADGYSLVYPAEYYVVITETGLCLTLSSTAVGACDIAEVAILEVREAGGLTAEQIAITIAPENDPNIRADALRLRIDGKEAVQLDAIRGDSWRIVIIVHAERAYIWKFSPWQLPPGMAEVVLQMERLYEAVINSFPFLD